LPIFVKLTDGMRSPRPLTAARSAASKRNLRKLHRISVLDKLFLNFEFLKVKVF